MIKIRLSLKQAKQLVIDMEKSGQGFVATGVGLIHL
jgi:hypothetical protein